MSKAFRCLWFLLIVRPVVRLLIGVAVFGREHLKLDRPTIIIANHNSHLDALVLMDLFPLRALNSVRPVAAADYFTRHPVTNFIWRACMNVLPIRRDKVSKTHNPLKAMIDALDAGQSIILFPEGTRGEPEQLSKFQTGIAHLVAKRPDVPVVPVFMRNLGFSLPRGDLILVPLFCDVFIGRPRHFSGDRQTIMSHVADCFAKLQALAERLRPSDLPEDDR
ncbi:MAG: 1-acyl-sn-glycerol-3-phosphate acyltransferase [Phycisphaerales bacterium]|nr:1-acyl-sn-glycerol-3-phosphate acyltransferase [Phycisphaerales bacterium]